MKIAFAYGSELLGNRALDFRNLWTDKRGMTGSESSLLILAAQLSLLGHEVTLFIPSPNESQFSGVRLRDLGAMPRESGEFDVVVSFIWSRYLMPPYVTKSEVVRVNFQTCNSFDYEEEHFEDHVDLFLSPSETHRAYMEPWTVTVGDKWKVLRLGCFTDDYGVAEKVPGRVAWISSPDRGLHHVLHPDVWPKIKEAVPDAELRIFYFGLEGYIGWAAGLTDESEPYLDRREHGRRARIIRDGLTYPGVRVMGSTSREDMRRELSEAMVLAFPCDTVLWSEGFSCSTLEGCAAGAVPVLAACDAIGDVYRGACPIVPSSAGEHLAEWRDTVIALLTDPAGHRLWQERAREFAEKHDYRDIARDLERMLLEEVERKTSGARRPLSRYAKWLKRPYADGKVWLPPWVDSLRGVHGECPIYDAEATRHANLGRRYSYARRERVAAQLAARGE